MKCSIWRITLFFLIAILPLASPAYSADKTEEMASQQTLSMIRELLRRYPDEPELGKFVVDYTQAILTHPKLKFNPKKVRALQRAALSVETGHSEQIFSNHPDLQQFIAANNDLLYEAFKAGVSISVDPKDDMPLLLKDGFLVRWDALKRQIAVDGKGRLIGLEYDNSGLVPLKDIPAGGHSGVKKPHQFSEDLWAAYNALKEFVEKLPPPNVYADDDKDEVFEIIEKPLPITSSIVDQTSQGTDGQGTGTDDQGTGTDDQKMIEMNDGNPTTNQFQLVPYVFVFGNTNNSLTTIQSGTPHLQPEVLGEANVLEGVTFADVPDWSPVRAAYLTKGIIEDTVYAIKNGKGEISIYNYKPGLDHKLLERSEQYLAEVLKREVNSHYDKADAATRLLYGRAAEVLAERLTNRDPTLAEELKDVVVVAARLGLPLDVLSANLDFVAFVNENHLFKSMEYFEHTAGVIGSEPTLMVNGQQMAWTQVKELLGDDKNRKMVNHAYTYQGLVPASVTQSPVFFQNQADQRFYVQVVHSRPKDQSFLGKLTNVNEHVWIRIVDSEGNVRSFGFHPNTPLKLSPWDIAGSLLSDQPARVMSPDYFELLAAGLEVTATTIELSEAQYDRLTQAIVQFASTNQLYSLWTKNCVWFVSDVLGSVGIRIDPKWWTSQVRTWIEGINGVRESVLLQARSDQLSEGTLDQLKFWFPLSINDNEGGTSAQLAFDYCDGRRFLVDNNDSKTQACQIWNTLSYGLKQLNTKQRERDL